MNFTITASIISILIIVLYASSHNRLYNIEYTPFSKLEALDYIVVVNALASGKIDPMLSKGFVEAGLKVKYTIREKTLNKDVKRLAITIASSIMGVVEFSRAILLKKGLIRKLLRKIIDVNILALEKLLETSIDAMIILEPAAVFINRKILKFMSLIYLMR